MDRDRQDATDEPQEADRPEFPARSPWHQPPVARTAPTAPANDEVEPAGDGASRQVNGHATVPAARSPSDTGRVPNGQVRWSQRRIGIPVPVP